MANLEIKLITAEQCKKYEVAMAELRSLCDKNSVECYEWMEVMIRIHKAHDRQYPLEGGCALRVMRVALRLRSAGVDIAPVVELARQLISQELLPSPKWLLMCSEMGIEAAPTGTIND